MSKLVRLKPYDPRRGYVVKQYTHGPTRTKFEEKRGWYRVDDRLANYLEELHQRENDPESPMMFNVCTPAEAEAMDKRERKQARERKTARDAMRDPVDVTSDAVNKRFAKPTPLNLSQGPGSEDEGDEGNDGNDDEDDDTEDAPEVPEPLDTKVAKAESGWDDIDDGKASAKSAKKTVKGAKARSARSMVAAEE